MRRKCDPATSVLTIIGIIAALITISMIPEIRRYLRIRRM